MAGEAVLLAGAELIERKEPGAPDQMIHTGPLGSFYFTFQILYLKFRFHTAILSCTKA